MKRLTFWINVVFASPLLLTAAYAVWYWAHGHAALTDWYLSLNPNLYHVDEWRNTLFTPATKAAGNGWCAAAVVAAAVVFLLSWQYPPQWPAWSVEWRKQAIPWLLLCAAAFALALLTWGHAKYAADEVFSGLNFAAISPFQTASYYVRPNNHVLFNVFNALNPLASHPQFSGEPVESGRLVSMGCFAIFLCSVWYFFQKWLPRRWQVALATAVVAVQFPVWGFAAQARGYELLLLLSWWSFSTFLHYQQTGNQRSLVLHTLCNALGMLTLPTYLYWWLGLGVTAVLGPLWQRRFDWA